MSYNKDLHLRLLRCNECGHVLDEIRERENIEGYIIDHFRFFKCSECGKKYYGYEYKINDEGNIIYFRLI